MDQNLPSEQAEALRTFRAELLQEGLISVDGDTLGTQHDWVLLYVKHVLASNIILR